MPILDIGMPPADDYPAHAEGVAADVWIKDVEGRPYLGQVRGVELCTGCCWTTLLEADCSAVHDGILSYRHIAEAAVQPLCHACTWQKCAVH